MKKFLSLLVVLWFISIAAFAETKKEEDPAKFKPLTEPELALHNERMCTFKLIVWFGENPPVEMDLTGKKPVTRTMKPIFSKKFDDKYYAIQKQQKNLKSEKSYDAAKKKEEKLNKEFGELIKETSFYKTCLKVTKKVAAQCVKHQENVEDLKKCLLFHQEKFDILDQHNSHIMDIPDLKKKVEQNAKWLDE